MKKLIYITTVILLLISLTCLNVSAAQKITVKGHLFFDVWQGQGEASLEIAEACIPGITVSVSEFEKLTLNKNTIDSNYYYITTQHGATIITLKEDYLNTLEDGCYYMQAEFSNAIVPVTLYVVTQPLKVTDICFNFDPWLGSNNAAVILNPNLYPVPIWADLFESLSYKGKEIDKENYSVSNMTNAPIIMLNEEYVKTFAPGEYYFSADFVNLKDVMLKLRVFGANLPGDPDGDGKLSAKDARTTLRTSVNLDKLTTEQKLAADINNDSNITAADARIILRLSVGLEKTEQYI